MNERRRRRALITRPREDSADAAIALARQGITPVLAPMMRIEYASASIDRDLETAQAILFTSRNGVRAFSRISDRRDVPVFAVGDSTAALARDNGFGSVESASGDSSDLARLVSERLDPANGPLFHAAGAAVAGDLAEVLSQPAPDGKAGFEVTRRTLYEARAVDALDPDTEAALRDRTLDYVLLFSPRTARIFAERVTSAGLAGTCDSLAAICLSDAVASAIGEIPWREVAVAAAPTTSALLTALSRIDGSASPDAVPEPVVAPAPLQKAVPTEEPPPEPEIAPNPVEPPPEPETGSEPVEPESAPVEDTDVKNEKNMSDTETARAPAKPADQAAEESTGAGEAVRKLPPGEDLPEPATAPAAAQGASGGSRGRAIVVTLLIVGGALGAAYMTLPSWRDKLPTDVRAHLSGDAAADRKALEENAALQLRIGDLETRAKQAETALGAAREASKTADEKTQAQIADLTARLAAAEKTAADLRAANSEGAAAAAENAALKQKIATLEGDIAKLSNARDSAETAATNSTARIKSAEAALAAEKERSDTLEQKIAAFEKDLAAARKAAEVAGKADTIAVAAGRLRNALDGAAPFSASFAALKDAGGASPKVMEAIAGLEPFAEKGAPTRAMLFERLPATVREALTADREPRDQNLIDRAVSKLTGFVSVRRIDGKGTGAEAALARAEIAARKDDLAAAAAELKSLTGASAKAAAGWVADAEARLAADKARIALDDIVLKGVAGGDGS